jgi:nitroimidazol reductase NimA-like FMN-containing flavoprotein (pyridoxamine 5'-phosphate oxidase superfamily)
MTRDPVTTLDARFSMDGAAPTSWPEARRVLEEASTYWVTTVRRDGRPHVTTLQAVWDGDALHFLCGPTEQKTKNLENNRSCILTTGCNDFDEGLDVVVEGEAVRITDDERLRALAEAWETKYGPAWHFNVREGTFRQAAGLPGGEEAPAYVFEVAPVKAFGFRKGFGKDGQGSQTRWRWDAH